MSEKNKILVEAQPFYIKEQSSESDSRYVFAYTISIRNTGINAVRLLNRHWLITDSNGKVQEVSGSGVVGKQPYLKAGGVFRYTSGAMIETSVGIMEGRYEMISDTGEKFTALIPRFTLSIPRTLH